MKVYARLGEGEKAKDTKSMFFAHGAASFQKFGTEEQLCKGCDMLLVGKSGEIGKPFISFELNAPARVFVLLVGGATKGLSKNIARGPAAIITLRDGRHPTAILLEHSGGKQYVIASGSPLWFCTVEQEVLAIGFEVTLPTSLNLTLPSPRTIRINDLALSSYFVLFTKPASP